MVTIRLARHGSKKNPFYHITVADRRRARDGRFIERLGFFNPVAKGKSEEYRLDTSRFDYWVSKGAQPSEVVKKIVSQARKDANPAQEAASSEA
jgi:small subunit ribosomal protein S16